MKDKSYLTAITRKKMSRPAQFLSDVGKVIRPGLDYGCGKSPDSNILGLDRYDPFYCNIYPVGNYKTILCTYVLNVLPDITDRFDVLNNIKSLLAPDGVAYITVRNDVDNLRGWTSRGTWQGWIRLNLPKLIENDGFTIYVMTKHCA